METSFKFTMPMRVDVVEEKGEQKIFLEGFLSTSDLDLVNDIVTKSCLESMKTQILDRNIKLDIEHESFRGSSIEEREINKTRIPAGRFIDAAVESLGNSRWGLRVKAVLNRFHPRYSEIKGNVTDRMLDAYSIAFIATKARKENVSGKSVRFLDDVALLNAALTGNPINTEALNREIFIKSLNTIEDYQEEKKSNPETEKLLEVKSQSSPSGQDISYKDERRTEKSMDSEKKDQVVEKKEEGVHGGTYGKEGGDAPGEAPKKKKKEGEEGEEEEEESEMKAEVKSLQSQVDVLVSEVKALKAIPVMKSPMESAKGVEQKSEPRKSAGPLDYI